MKFWRQYALSLKTGFLKNGSYDFFKNTRFWMRKMSPKTPHTHFLCCFQLYKLPLKTNRDFNTLGRNLLPFK
jgi:hypothetical protein